MVFEAGFLIILAMLGLGLLEEGFVLSGWIALGSATALMLLLAIIENLIKEKK
ncbi:MAG: hypothetical protein PHS73_01385 [Candidatus Peribacteraceae bacterium]|nr:hypothetical protein [Candidatus Peribacteraceae bacterium]